MVLIKKLFRSYSRRFAAAKRSRYRRSVEVREKEDYKLSKDEVPNSETANREAGETQQRQVTETIKRDIKDKP
jgi:preprotein translocase subunit SecA